MRVGLVTNSRLLGFDFDCDCFHFRTLHVPLYIIIGVCQPQPTVFLARKRKFLKIVVSRCCIRSYDAGTGPLISENPDILGFRSTA